MRDSSLLALVAVALAASSASAGMDASDQGDNRDLGSRLRHAARVSVSDEGGVRVRVQDADGEDLGFAHDAAADGTDERE
jgi:hypothetical protein